MFKPVTPKNTILLFTLFLLLMSYIVLDQIYRKWAETIMLTTIRTSSKLIRDNDLIDFMSRIKEIKSEETFIKAIHLLDEDYRRVYKIGEDIALPNTLFRSGTDSNLFMNGLLKYGFRYKITNENEVFFVFAYLYDDDRWIKLAIVDTFIVLLFCTFFLICRRFDIDRLDSQSTKYALHLLSCGLHEIKQIVNLMNVVAERFENDRFGMGDDPVFRNFRSDFERCRVSISSMMSVVALAKKDKQHLRNCDRGVDLAEVLDTCLESYKKSQVIYEATYDHSTPVFVPIDGLYAIVGNLIRNAFAYSGRFVWVKTYECNGYICVQIANSGRKIPKKMLKDILKPGVSIEGQSGLGLHICHMWCKVIGAKLEVESNEAATAFTIRFPSKRGAYVGQPKVIKPIATESIRPESVPPGARVAIIDDMGTFRDKVSIELTDAGFVATAFECMDVFLDAIKQDAKAFDSVVVDRHGPGSDAVMDQFPESCRFYGFGGTIVLYSSDIGEFTTEEYQKMGFDNALSKGVKIEWKSVLSVTLPAFAVLTEVRNDRNSIESCPTGTGVDAITIRKNRSGEAALSL